MLAFALAGCATQGGPSAVTANANASSPPKHAATGQNHVKPYPFKNALTATVLGTPDRLKAQLPKHANFSIRTLQPLVDRKTPPTLRYARPLKYLLAAQDHPAPLAFVIAGTGDSALSSKCALLSRALYQVGYSVACLPSPTTVTFMLGVDRYPVPGRMTTDVAALYRLMQTVRDDVSDDLVITGYSLTGWSLGATEAAFIAHLDRPHPVFNFQHVLLLNPAVSLWSSVDRMDNLLRRDLPGGFDALPGFLARVLGNIQRSESQRGPMRFNEDALYRAYENGNFSHKEIGAIVGLAFRLSLANMAFAADVLTHSDVIVPKDVKLGPYDPLGLYFRRSFRMSFSDYVNRLLVPYWNRDGRHVSKSELISEGNLHRIAPFLARDHHVAVFTNADDPILDADEVGFLRHTFGNRARIRPHGGHLGNLSYKKTIRALQDFFTQ